MLSVLLPLKYVNFSKSRLNEILGDKKNNLVIALLEDMVYLLRKFTDVEIYLLTKKDNLAIIPKGLEVKFILEDENDLNKALEKGIKFLKPNYEKVLILPLDLPFINENDIKNLVSLSKEEGGVISPSSRDGTSAIILPLENNYKLQFGENSFPRHLSEFENQKIPFKIHYSESLFYDLDIPEDILRVLDIKAHNKACSLLKDIVSSDLNHEILVEK